MAGEWQESGRGFFLSGAGHGGGGEGARRSLGQILGVGGCFIRVG